MTRPTTRLRELLKGPKIVQAPGVVDSVGARIVAKEGFEAIYMTGAGTTASRLGWPDVGLLTMTEMADNAQRIAEASGLPLIADADTGYGGPLNVQRTIRTYERAGVSALHIEDQNWPKRCGHLEGKTLIPAEEMAAHLRAACDARLDQDFVIIARTDAIAVEGFDKAMERAKLYEEAGADVIFVEAPRTMEQLQAIPKMLNVPTLYNMASSGKTPFLTADEMQELGFRLVIYPNFMLMAAIPAMTRVLHELKRTGSIKGMLNEVASFTEFFDLMGMDQVKELEARYQVSDKARAGY
ncbi:2-methylisocitrate lyase-like PEP mutase family enzyme [Constrictibacter sp. MBR-5]|uniref:isocitrate lyase/PEP mutase family protein n=1 Tax=Constrictibacter sp. MBR-5 TaxID=3156467 RepID=UPI00339298C0